MRSTVIFITFCSFLQYPTRLCGLGGPLVRGEMPAFACPSCRTVPTFMTRVYISGPCPICIVEKDQLVVYGPCGHPVCEACWEKIWRRADTQPLIYDMRVSYSRRRYRCLEDDVMAEAETLPLPGPEAGAVTPPPPLPLREPPPVRAPGIRPKAKARPPALPQLPGQALPSDRATPPTWEMYYYEAFAEALWFPMGDDLVVWAFEAHQLFCPVLVRRATIGVSFYTRDLRVPPGLSDWMPVWNGHFWTLFMPAGVYEGVELARVGPLLY